MHMFSSTFRSSWERLVDVWEVLGAAWIPFGALGMYGGGLGASLDTILGAGDICGKSWRQSGCRLGISEVSRSKAREKMTT